MSTETKRLESIRATILGDCCLEQLQHQVRHLPYEFLRRVYGGVRQDAGQKGSGAGAKISSLLTDPGPKLAPRGNVETA